MSRSHLAVCGVLVLALGGCQSLREEMLAANYPPTFVDGFEAGCSSGRSAAGPLGRYAKDVACYLSDPLYHQGWDDGFSQCESSQQDDTRWESADQKRRDRQWRHHVDQAMARALTR
ncbi:MAG: hypothetical protein ACK4TD_21575 [Ectopseudomonas guguanensis]|uniref:Lipoprotein n=1 Tax=Ectopseudomonas guguanensis TaxID=1198456 RepID=A0A1H0RM17_9GAMM|nr:hypothetical protein [Pseudomonas guguanensis]SDP30492.1 hypothetical protein SAMN05216213_103294 [Pseudomonas guguanensis]